MEDGKRVGLNVKILPLQVVRQFCELLESRGVAVVTEDNLVARRMSSQISGAMKG